MAPQLAVPTGVSLVLMQDPVPFAELADASLVLEREYLGGTAGTSADDPLASLLPVGNQGGFRYKGSPAQGTVQLLVLYTSGTETDWPDTIDPETGDFTYYGDNRQAGSLLHETRRKGNLLLRDIFEWSRGGPEDRERVPVILLFEKSGRGRAVRFRGLLVPGSPRLTSEEELVAIWRTTRDHRFQNYRAHFTILNEAVVSRAWIDQILAGDPLGRDCPGAWRRWVQARIFDPLEAPRTVVIPTKDEQYPATAAFPLLEAVHQHFSARPVAFEHFAADLWVHSDPHVESIDVTRPTRDGGRDAVGTYRIGPSSDPVRIDFALEAKCLAPRGGGVDVRMVSRLISGSSTVTSGCS